MISLEEINRNLQGITRKKTFINKYNWEGINFLSEKYDWKQLQKNVTVALNALNVKIEKHSFCLHF